MKIMASPTEPAMEVAGCPLSLMLSFGLVATAETAQTKLSM